MRPTIYRLANIVLSQDPWWSTWGE